jgi:uncharacterized repeat protein (TIGR03803 family)
MGACASSGLSSSPSSLAPQNPSSLAAPSRGPGSPLGKPGLTILHSFDGPTGWGVGAGVIDVNGTLYGTTVAGGGGVCNRKPTQLCGVVFKVAGTGTSVLHSFSQDHAGYGPFASVINLEGTLYGTTAFGGAHECGTVFALVHKDYSVIHSFDCANGKDPEAGLTDVDGTLYGTTVYGGNTDCYCGEVFKITNVGSGPEFSVVYAFKGGSDGANPHAGLLYANNKLYGTTANGGAANVGTVFSLDTDGTEKVLYSFKGGSDGAHPRASVIDVDGAFFGTTEEGGCFTRPCGTVFRVTTKGKEHVLHIFTGHNTDSKGGRPVAGLLEVGDKLYGTTRTDGKHHAGTIFSINSVGNVNYTVIHSFVGQPDDGSQPRAGLIEVGGALYGTTSIGGEYNGGTVFKLRL